MRTFDLNVAIVAVAALSSVAAGQEWEHTGGPHGANVKEVVSGGGHAFAVTTGGLCRFDAAPGAWSLLDTSPFLPLGPNPAVFAIETVPGAVLITTGGGELIRSLDHGATWQALAPLGQNVGLTADGDRLYASTSTGVLRSTDQGSTWTPISFPGGAGFHARGDVLLAGTLSDYFVSLDGGQTHQTRPMPQVGFAAPVAFASTSHGFYMIVNSFLLGGATVHRSTNQGASFQQIASIGAVRDTVIDGDTVYLLTDGPTNRLLRISGGTITEVGTLPAGTQSQRELRMTRLGGEFLVGTPDMGMLRSADGGQSWAGANEGLGFTTVTNMAAGNGVTLASLHTGHGVWRYAAGEWAVSAPLPGGGNIIALHHLGGASFIAGTDGEGIFRSGDHGATWTFSSGGLPQYNGSAGLKYREVEDFAHTSSAIFACLGFGTEMTTGQHGQFTTSGGGLVRSTDGGATWQRVNGGLPIITTNNFGDPIYDPFFSMAALGETVFAGAGSTGIWRSTNGGASWQQVATFQSVNDMATLNGKVYAATPAGVFASADAGATWAGTGFPGGTLALGVAAGKVHAAAVPVNGSGGGIYRLEAAGWQRTDTDFDRVLIRAMAGEGATLFAGTDHLGAWSLGSGCYANCDGSTAPPVLNVADFSCFLQRFAAGEPYANCDNSTAPPVLNVADFSCFLQRFAAGCP